MADATQSATVVPTTPPDEVFPRTDGDLADGGDAADVVDGERSEDLHECDERVVDLDRLLVDPSLIELLEREDVGTLTDGEVACSFPPRTVDEIRVARLSLADAETRLTPSENPQSTPSAQVSTLVDHAYEEQVDALRRKLAWCEREHEALTERFTHGEELRDDLDRCLTAIRETKANIENLQELQDTRARRRRAEAATRRTAGFSAAFETVRRRSAQAVEDAARLDVLISEMGEVRTRLHGRMDAGMVMAPYTDRRVLDAIGATSKNDALPELIRRRLVGAGVLVDPSVMGEDRTRPLSVYVENAMASTLATIRAHAPRGNTEGGSDG